MLRAGELGQRSCRAWSASHAPVPVTIHWRPPCLRALRRIAASTPLLLLMTLIWGTNYALVKYAFREIDPQAFNALRC